MYLFHIFHIAQKPFFPQGLSYNNADFLWIFQFRSMLLIFITSISCCVLSMPEKCGHFWVQEQRIQEQTKSGNKKGTWGYTQMGEMWVVVIFKSLLHTDALWLMFWILSGKGEVCTTYKCSSDFSVTCPSLYLLKFGCTSIVHSFSLVSSTLELQRKYLLFLSFVSKHLVAEADWLHLFGFSFQ